MDTSPLRVAIISPQLIVEAGLAAVLAAALDRVQVVPFKIGDRDPDVVFYDAIALENDDSSDLDHLINETSSAVLIVSRDLRPGLAAQALAAGADGHISIGASLGEVLEAVESTATGWKVGDLVTNPQVGNIDSPSGRALTGGRSGLSQRERETLTLIGAGHTNAEIGGMLFLSVNTVKTNIRSAYAKLGVTSRSQATAWAIAHGLTAGSDARPPATRRHRSSDRPAP